MRKFKLPLGLAAGIPEPAQIHVRAGRALPPCSAPVTSWQLLSPLLSVPLVPCGTARTGIHSILLLKENQHFQEPRGLDVVLFLSPWCGGREHRIPGSHRATRGRGQWQHKPKASLNLAYSEPTQGHLCHTRGLFLHP